MFRTQRATASLIRALMIGTASSALLMSVATLVGCQDESQPEYWVGKLEDDAWRVRAIKQLDQFYEDAVTRANNQTGDSPEIKALVEKIVVPLTSTYVAQYDNLDEKARHRLIKLLATMRDPRTEPALTKALSEFAQKGRGGEDLKWSARAVADMKMTTAADEMLGAFVKLRADSEEGGAVYRDLNMAMLEMADKSWSKTLIQKLEPTLELPQQGEQNKEKVTEFRNQQFWQTTSAQLLGAIGDPAAVDPLLKVLLDPGKANLHADAVVSLVKLGKPAVARASQLLAGEDKEMVEFAALRARKAAGQPLAAGDEPHVRTAAMVLGTIGHASAAPTLISALPNQQNESNKAVILRELAKLPASGETKQAFQAGFAALSPDAVIPPGQPAQQVLAESATSFFDPQLVPWLLQQAAGVKDDDQTRSALLVAAIKLMPADQVGSVGAAVNKYGSELEKSLLSEASAVVKSCGKDVACYLEAATKSANQEGKSQFAGIKAAYMLGILGNEKVRDQLVAGVDPISNAAVRFTAAKVIDHLSPKGSTAAADDLQKLVDINVKRGDPGKIAGDAPLKQVIYRLRSRAQS